MKRPAAGLKREHLLVRVGHAVQQERFDADQLRVVVASKRLFRCDEDRQRWWTGAQLAKRSVPESRQVVSGRGEAGHVDTIAGLDRIPLRRLDGHASGRVLDEYRTLRDREHHDTLHPDAVTWRFGRVECHQRVDRAEP